MDTNMDDVHTMESMSNDDLASMWRQLEASLNLEGIQVRNNVLGNDKEYDHTLSKSAFKLNTEEETQSQLEGLPDLVGTFEDIAQAGGGGSAAATSFMFPKNNLHTKIGGVSKYGGGGGSGGKKNGNGGSSNDDSISMNRLRQRHNWITLDVKELTLYKEVTKLQGFLTGAQINEGVINEIVKTYYIMQKVLRTNKRTIRTMKLFLSAAYYTMKRHFNPTPDEIAAIFRTDRKHVLQANRDNKRIAWLFKTELGFIFDNELGQTNLWRLASQYHLNKQVIKAIVQECKDMKTSVLDSVTVRKLVLKVAKSRI